MRKLVTIRTIGNVAPIPGADMIVKCEVDGWTVVSKKGEFEPGDKCVFFEIDSFLPADDPRFEFLKKTGVKTDPSGAPRVRLKTVKLRKQLSQGLALPLDLFDELRGATEDEDLSDRLNVIKYERPEPQQANAAKTRPDYFPKTDEERIQNVYNKYDYEYFDEWYVPTLKLDGSSCTVAFIGIDRKDDWNYEHDVPEGEDPKCLPWITQDGKKLGEVVYCSRNMQLKRDTNSHFWKAVMEAGLFDKIRDIAVGEFNLESIAIQGEVCGPGIQGNNEKLNDYQFFAFNLFDIKYQKYLLFPEAQRILGDYGVPLVPVLDAPTQVFQSFATLTELLKYADGPSMNGKRREGVVFKPAYRDDVPSFKVISNAWLLKGGDD